MGAIGHVHPYEQILDNTSRKRDTPINADTPALKRFAPALIPIGFAFVGLWPFLDFSRIIGEWDNLFSMYILEHGYRWLTGMDQSFWDAPFYYPAKNMIAYSDDYLGNLPLYAPIRLFAANRELAFQLWIAASLLLNFAIAYWSLRKLDCNLVGSTAGAYLFSYGLPMVAQFQHAQFAPRYMVPLAFLFASRLLAKGSRKYFAGTLCAIVWQLYISIYTGLFLCLCLAVYFLMGFWLLRREKPWQKILGCRQETLLRIVLLAFSVIALLPTAVPHYLASSETGIRSWEEVSCFLPRIRSWLFPSFRSAVWGWLADNRTLAFRSLPCWYEQQLFVGAFPTLIFLAFPFCRRRLGNLNLRNFSTLAWLLIAFMCILTLYLSDYSPYNVIYHLPGFGAVRAVGRVVLVLLFPLAILSAATITAALKHLALTFPQRGYQRLTLPVVSAMILFAFVGEHLCASSDAISVRQLRKELRKIKKFAKAEPSASSILWVPPGPGEQFGHRNNTYAMLAAQDMGLPTANGISSNAPPGYSENVYQWLSSNGIALERLMVIPYPSFNNAYHLGTKASFDLFSNAAAKYARSGWGGPESWGMWSLGKRSSLELKIVEHPSSEMELTLEVFAFVCPAKPNLTVVVTVNAAEVAKLDFDMKNSAGKRTILLSESLIASKEGNLTITFDYDDVRSPNDLHISDDRRNLALKLISLELRPVANPSGPTRLFLKGRTCPEAGEQHAPPQEPS
jgi:hypothetical protein